MGGAPSRLPADMFRQVVDSTPLISIDLVIERTNREFLLGLRNNRPAQGFWFVPGGRIFKGESLDDAFLRLTRDELGVSQARSDARSLGVFEHFYMDSIFGEEISTHYIVLAYHLCLDIELMALPLAQHCDYRWCSNHELACGEHVHPNSRAYAAVI